MIARDQEPEPIRTIDEIAAKNPGKSRWESFCGRYEHPEDAEFVGEDEFGRRGGMLRLKFADGCLIMDDITFKKP